MSFNNQSSETVKKKASLNMKSYGNSPKKISSILAFECN